MSGVIICWPIYDSRYPTTILGTRKSSIIINTIRPHDGATNMSFPHYVGAIFAPEWYTLQQAVYHCNRQLWFMSWSLFPQKQEIDNNLLKLAFFIFPSFALRCVLSYRRRLAGCKIWALFCKWYNLNSFCNNESCFHPTTLKVSDHFN